MENVLLKYLSDMVKEPVQKKTELGPAITISRDFGCEGSAVAQMLVEAINEKSIREKNTLRWKVISKEILEKSAQELHSRPLMLSHYFNAEERGFYAEIITSFAGKYYVSDTRIKHAITKVIKEFAEQGQAVIIGRGAFAFTKHISRSLHVKLTAPFNWRVNNVAKRFNLSYEDAKVHVAEVDNKRNAFHQLFIPNHSDCENFDVIFNRTFFSKQEIVDAIMKIVDTKKIT